MSMTKEWVSIFFASILTSNFVLARFLGICPFLGVSKQVNTASGMGIAVTFVMTLSTAVIYPINLLLQKTNLEYLQTIVFILVIAALVQFVEIVLKRYVKPLYRSLGIYLPLITTNCAVLGVVLINVRENYAFGTSMVSSVGAGIGFLLAMVLFAGVRQRMEECDIPQTFKGLPATLIAASIVSLSFLGFGGVVEKLFG